MTNKTTHRLGSTARRLQMWADDNAAAMVKIVAAIEVAETIGHPLVHARDILNVASLRMTPRDLAPIMAHLEAKGLIAFGDSGWSRVAKNCSTCGQDHSGRRDAECSF